MDQQGVIKSNADEPAQIAKELIAQAGSKFTKSKYVLLFRTGGWLLLFAMVFIYLVMSVFA